MIGFGAPALAVPCVTEGNHCCKDKRAFHGTVMIYGESLNGHNYLACKLGDPPVLELKLVTVIVTVTVTDYLFKQHITKENEQLIPTLFVLACMKMLRGYITAGEPVERGLGIWLC